jgi:ATP-dependent RNA helicase DeaD
MTPLSEDLAATIGPELAAAFEARGFATLTPVQEAVLNPELQDRDLRISSQTGSGKTVAIGFVMRDAVCASAASDAKAARPRALVITPTRELAKQVEGELSWLYEGLGARVASVTGGSGYRDELRSFKRGPAVVVGTPGRMLDHLTRGAIDASNVAVVVLDEADRMLDLGFRDDLEQILAKTPETRRTHLVSATFPREVTALANRVQTAAVNVEGTPLGAANTDIEHVMHLVHPKERVAAIVNLLLASPGAQTLVFARTRADVAALAAALDAAGFTVGMLSGEMEQPERNRALSAFKRGSVAALVATDVAARGIDVIDIARVIHAEPPSDTDAYTHRSGRTGRAGRKGTSSLLVAPSELVKTLRLLARARVHHRFEPVPSAASIRRAEDERLFAELTADGQEEDARAIALAERLAASAEPTRVIARLVARSTSHGAAAPRELTPIDPPARARGPHPDARRSNPHLAPRLPKKSEGWVQFRVSWGQAHGADTRRLVAMLCRRGRIEGRDIGAIDVRRTSSIVEIASGVADAFERAAGKPDPRDPRISIRRWVDHPAPAPRTHAREPRRGGDETPKRAPPARRSRP